MFYSQIILAKKGPLAKVWMAAHWDSKKLGRPAVFSANVADLTDSIVHPTTPLALRVSGHLLLGVVRIYSQKVTYLYQDCTEAMVKLKMAFSAACNSSNNNDNSNGTNHTGIDLVETANSHAGGGNLNVANFGEYSVWQQVDATAGGGFGIPFDILEDDAAADDWVPADTTAAAAAAQEHASDDRDREYYEQSQQDLSLSIMSKTTREEEWTAFDPDDEPVDEPVDAAGAAARDESHVSDIEVTRAVNDSIASEVRRASVLEKQDGEPPVTPASDSEFPLADDDGDFGNIPFDDDDYDRGGVQQSPLALRESLNLSLSRDDSTATANAGGAVSVGGLDISNATADTTNNTNTTTKRKRSVTTKTRKRRKVVIDNEHTELSNQHIKNMLADTSDIVQQNRLHPSTWIPTGHNNGHDDNNYFETMAHTRSDKELLLRHLPYERLFCRPAVGDDGQLAPALLDLWAKNTAPVLGKPFPYRMREQEEDASVESVEVARQQRESLEDQESVKHPMDQDDDFPPPDDQDDVVAMDDDAPAPFDDDDGGVTPAPQDNSGFANDMEGMVQSPESQRSLESSLSLGLVNALEDDILGDDDDNNSEQDDPRQGAGDTVLSSAAKWHRHTVKVHGMLQNSMAASDDVATAGNENKPKWLSYDKMSKGVSRRTAAGVFFELLQLKTWDYIDLDQDESYGDIKISPGAKFMEDPPTN